MSKVGDKVQAGNAAVRRAWDDHERWEQHYKAAEARYREALALEPDHVVASINLGAVLSDTGHHKQALKLLREIEKRGVVEKNLLRNIAVAMMNRDATRADARAYFQKAEEADAAPDTIAAYFDPHGH